MATQVTKLENYKVLHKIGEGGYAQVYLALNRETKEKCALKVMKAKNLEEYGRCLRHCRNEVVALKALDHPNIVKLRDCDEEHLFNNAPSQEQNSTYIVQELAAHGDLFDFIVDVTPFSDQIARFYFHQLIEGLEHIHNKGFVHRDLKLENLLLDADFNLKIVDFGFAAPLKGHDGSGKLSSFVGTPYYMAPEIYSGKPYKGTCIDIFAAGVILFVMLTGGAPFTAATPQDGVYKVIIKNRWDLFWKAHSARSGPGKFSKEFMELITSMLSADPEKRPTLGGIKTHPWYTGEVLTYEQIAVEMQKRKLVLDSKRVVKKEEEAESSFEEEIETNDSIRPDVYEFPTSAGFGRVAKAEKLAA